MEPRRRVAVLGATGAVGQRFLQLLAGHPWFEVTALMASPGSAGRRYGEAVGWTLPDPVSPGFAEMVLQGPEPRDDVDILFSAVGADVAERLEEQWARAGVAVFSNARTHRMDPDVPLVIPEVNPDHLDLLVGQRRDRGFPGRGGIVTNANCSSTFLTMALAPLHRRFGLDGVTVATLQAMSGAGLGLAALRIQGNVIPFIGGEEPKLESEPLKMLGQLNGSGVVEPADIRISAQVNRVPVVDGHTEAVSVSLRTPAAEADLVDAFSTFRGPPQELGLPSAPSTPLVVMQQEDRPQPALDLGVEDGMATVIGRIRPCPVLDWKFTLLGHNTVRGAAAGSLLNAELACVRDLV